MDLTIVLAFAMLVCFYLGYLMIQSGNRLLTDGYKISGYFRIFCAFQFIIYPIFGLITIFF